MINLERNIMILSTFLILTLHACTPTTDNVVEYVPPVELTQLTDLVNDVRSKGCRCGRKKMKPVGKIRLSNQLSEIAQSHSVDMDRRNYFSHKDKKGRNGGDRMTMFGYEWQAWGENIAFGYKSERAVFITWLKSKTHCINLMDGSYTEMGFGENGTYWTQLFGTPFN